MFLWGDGQQKKRAPMIPLPKEAASRAASLGKAGAQWLSHLEKNLQSLESQWGVPAGGSHGLACPCDGQDGKAYVLKIDVPPALSGAGAACNRFHRPCAFAGGPAGLRQSHAGTGRPLGAPGHPLSAQSTGKTKNPPYSTNSKAPPGFTQGALFHLLLKPHMPPRVFRRLEHPRPLPHIGFGNVCKNTPLALGGPAA